MSCTASKVLAVAIAEIGYKEKASNSQLDDKTSNAGANNYTKYARDFDEKYPNWYNGKKNGYAWCDMFVDWCFLTAFGYTKALSLLCQPEKSCGAGCTYSAQYYKNKGQFYTSNPKAGDQIFFGTSISNCSHTGIVEKADSSKVYTIEGNTSNQVARRTYALNNSTIVGYGRPKYDAETTTTTPTTTTTTITSTGGTGMKYNSSNKPLVCMMTQSTCYKGTRTMTPVGVLWHSTGANNPNLKRYVQPDDNASDRADLLAKLGTNSNKNDWNHINHQAGLNCWIGKLADGTVTTVQTMPWNYRPWGCGSGGKGSCNNGWIQFEICEDGLTDSTYFNKVYKEACEITAYLCKMYGIDPNGSVTMNGVKVPTILCHADSHALGLGSNHGDVNHWFPKHGKSMTTARTDVAKLMGTSSTSSTQESSTATGTSTSTSTAFGSIKAGDKVKITSSATYYNGKVIPTWVKNKNWIVKSVNGDRAVIDKSADGKNAICSPINTKYLTVVSDSNSSSFVSYRVKINASVLNIRKGAGTNYAIAGTIRDKGVYTIVAEADGNGATKWGKLKSGIGWISLDYADKV